MDRRRRIHGDAAELDGPSGLGLSGFFLGMALLAAIFGIGATSGVPSDMARLLFFVFLVLGMAPLLRCVTNETS